MVQFRVVARRCRRINMECKNCAGVFGKVVKDGLCSHCKMEADELKGRQDSLHGLSASEIEGNIADWPEDHDERED